MKIFVRGAFLAVVLFAGISALSAAQISLGVRIGEPPPPRVIRVVPQRPGGEFVWVDGYWYPVGRRYVWHAGYWTRPPYEGARWVGPRHDGAQFFAGYWDGDRGHVEHDHRWDHDHDRDDHGRDDHGHDDHGHDHDRDSGRGRDDHGRDDHGHDDHGHDNRDH